MKFRDARISANDDGSFQVEVSGYSERNDGPWSGPCKELKYSASSLSDVASKIEQGIKKLEGMRDGKKKKEKGDHSVKGFLGDNATDE